MAFALENFKSLVALVAPAYGFYDSGKILCLNIVAAGYGGNPAKIKGWS